MSSDAFDRRVEHIWADYFGCSIDELQLPGTTLLPRERMRAEGVIHIATIRARALVEIDPLLEAALGRALTDSRAVLTSTLLRETWGDERILASDSGLVFHLRPEALVRPEADAQLTVRGLTRTDQPALAALRSRCTQSEIDEAYVELDHEIACGCFHGSELVAVGSAYRRNGFMDFGVLTDPAYRGQQLAGRIVCALTDETWKVGLIPQYRCDARNTASRRVAEKLGFSLYFTTDTLRVKSG